MATISCGHCGHTHSSVAEVRRCATTDGAVKAHTSSEAGSPTRSKLAKASLTGLTAVDLAGPPVLGRSLLLSPQSPVPDPWGRAEQVTANQEAKPATVERLLQAWRDREAIVVRWTGPLPDLDQRDVRSFHQLSPNDGVPNEELAFAITANMIDGRTNAPTFAPLTRGLGLGAALPTDATQPQAGGQWTSRPDLILADGRLVLVDGGPLDLDLADQVEFDLIPRVHLVSASLRPLSARSAPSASLAVDQLAAVAHRSGPARILAPAGSGKTRVLTERARHLVVDCSIAARSVCLVAYNRRARDEMHERLTDVGALEIRTLNSLALALATASGPFEIGQTQQATRRRTIDEFESRRLLDRLLPGRRRRALSDPLEPWIDALSACRLGLRDPHEIEESYNGDVPGFPEVLDRYRRELEKQHVVDFDEQILVAIDRLRHEPEMRDRARSVAPVILVDEFQDLTPAHLLLLRLLAGPAAEIFAVGDDDQTIYSYAGASPDWLIDFDRFFPGSSEYHLTVNYRCPPPVVDAAVNLLSHNRRRVTKRIEAPARSGPSSTEAGLSIISEVKPQRALVDCVMQILANGSAPADIAILARVNAALLAPALFLHHQGIPVVRPAGLDSSMIDRSGVGAALAWIAMASGPEQGLAADHIRTALRRPPRSLHPRVADWACEQRSIADLRRLAARLNTERDSDNVRSFANDVARLRTQFEAGATTEELLSLIYDEIGLLGAASQLDSSQRSARRGAHSDELSALLSVAELCPRPADFEAWLRASIDDVPRFDPQQHRDGVALATVHTTKGLEWPHVIVHEARDDLFPHQLATDIEEERRVFHVGITRGRESVSIVVAGPPSRFVSELNSPRPAQQPWPDEKPESKTKTVETSRPEPSDAQEAARRERLGAWRRQRASADGVPAYVVLDNKTLDAIARRQPTSLAELGQIKGIGTTRLERYGADVLGVLASPEAN